jgi:hypothetical protein
MRFLHRSARPPVTEAPVAEATTTATEKETKEMGFTTDSRRDSDTESEEISKDAQAGVQRMEAVTKVWKKWHLVAAYLL